MNFTRIISRTLFLFSTVLLFISLPAQVRLAAVGGVHSSNLLETNSIPGFENTWGKYFSPKTGFQLGVLAEIPLGQKNFFFQPGIDFSAKGNQYERFYDTSLVKSDTLYDQHTLKLNYVEIPLYLTYKFPLSAKQRNYFFLSAGPYFAFIYSASQPYQNRVKYYNDDQYTFNSGTLDLPVGNGIGKYKTLDAGINIKAGFELGNVMLGAYYSRGLSNAYQAIYSSTFHQQLIGASLGIWLTKSKPAPPVNTDNDHDGTADKDDSCKMVAGIPKYHGCPIPDTDHDGVNDEEDSCKTIAGLARYHGCPIPDTDGDGVNDEEDSCKTIAGTVKYHGCPIPDSDGDGVNDEADQCPTQPGPVENKGCPVMVIKKELAKRVLFTARNVRFRSNSSRLTTNSLPALQELADTLRANPDLELTIEGHTDNTGNPEYNRKLSLKRAMEVKKTLQKLGVTEERISVEGLGDTQPAGDNRTKQGKSENRRVVFRLHVKNS
ncbi:MAG: OmpA family protein [Bacteroidota bacterium]|nr:OmpA family protein [Bacteroidota bacterium]MDP4211526.1 OmpA family protein [Bacteroidota bacterium]MDP4249741.1 OmpA family protein [Bacteroidota bacterium]